MSYQRQTSVQIVTPDMAEKWLENNMSNRPISIKDIQKLARDMRAGRFVTTHQGILLGKNGAIIDGQHRLYAIVSSGVSVMIQVTIDESIESPMQLPMDVGKKRTIAESIGVSNECAAVINLIYSICNKANKPTVSEAFEASKKIQPYFSMLPTKTRVGINAPTRVAAVTRIRNNPKEADYVISTFDAMVGDYTRLDPYPSSLFTQLVIDKRKMTLYETLGKSLMAFDPENKAKTRMVSIDSGKLFDFAANEVKKAWGNQQ